jgi:hypothetical protein
LTLRPPLPPLLLLLPAEELPLGLLGEDVEGAGGDVEGTDGDVEGVDVAASTPNVLVHAVAGSVETETPYLMSMLG